MELRDLRAFVAAAHELHFARGAARLYMSPSTMTELIHRLEQELGTPLFTRTTRRIALTEAGVELLERAEQILDLAAQATEAVGAIARGDSGIVRLGITPPAAPVLGPHLADTFSRSGAEVSIDVQRMWLPALGAALLAGTIDAALTCGGLDLTDADTTTAGIGAERLLVALRPGHRLVGEAGVDLGLLADETLGMHPPRLFPAWHRAQEQVLASAGITPPVAELDDTDLSSRRWTRQPDVGWIMLTGSLLAGHEPTDADVLPVPAHTVPFTLSWTTRSMARPVARRFVESSLAAPLPEGWLPPDR